jgi:hypothetical protein
VSQSRQTFKRTQQVFYCTQGESYSSQKAQLHYWSAQVLNKQKYTNGSLDFVNSAKTIALLTNDNSLLKLNLSIVNGSVALEFLNNEADLFHIIDGLSVVFHFEVTLRDESDGFDVADFELGVYVALLDLVGSEQNLQGVIVHFYIKVALA